MVEIKIIGLVIGAIGGFMVGFNSRNLWGVFGLMLVLVGSLIMNS